MPISHPPAVRHKVFEMYMAGVKNMKEISAETNVPYSTIIGWHQAENWAAKKQAFARALQADFENEQQKLIIKNRGQVANRHLTVSEKLDNTIVDIIDKSIDENGHTNLTARDISDLGKGFKNSSDPAARVVQLDRSPDDKGNSVNISTALIQVGVKPSVPEKFANAEAIDVEEVEFD